jgi:hypothetical protein
METKDILNQIKEILFGKEKVEIKMAEAISGDLTISVDGEDFEVGQVLYILSPEGKMPAPDGDYPIEGKLIVVTEGLISEIKDVEPEVVEEVEQKEEELPQEPKEDKMSEIEARLAKCEEKLIEMEGMFNEMAKYSKEVVDKIKKFNDETPAEIRKPDFKSFNDFMNEKKNTKIDRLEEIRKIRSNK